MILDRCSEMYCGNGGVATDISGECICDCEWPWRGDTCDEDDSDKACSENPCKNKGICLLDTTKSSGK